MNETLELTHYVSTELDHLYAQRAADIDRLESLADEDPEQSGLVERIDAAGSRICRLKRLEHKRRARSIRDREAARLWAVRRGEGTADGDPRIQFGHEPLVVPEWWTWTPDEEWCEKHGVPRQQRELDRLKRLERKGQLAAEMERMMDEARDLMKWSFQDRQLVRIQAARIEQGGSFWEFPPELRPGIAVMDMAPYLRGLLLRQCPDAAPDELWDVEAGVWYRVGRLTHDEVVEVVAAERPRFRLYSVEELGQFPPVEWFPGLEGYLPMRELIEVFGPGGSFKSFVLEGWAAHVSLQGHTVVYVAAEGASGLQARFAAWKTYYGVDSLPNLKVMPMPLRMQDDRDVAAFVEAIEAQLGDDRPAFVVIDTLGRNFVGGDENSAKDMGLFVEGAEQIRRKWDATVAIAHHTTKDGRSERGSEALKNATFAMYRFDASGLKVTVECVRMKDAPEPAPVRLDMVVVELEPDADGEPRSSLVAPWPFGEAPQPTTMHDLIEGADDDSKDAARLLRIAQDIKHYLERESMRTDPKDRYCSQTQVAKNVKGTDSLVIAVLKEIALDPYSPVQIEKHGKTVRYYYQLPPTD